jgi:hypothetical protein
MIAADPMPPLGDDDVVAVGFSTGDGRRGWWAVSLKKDTAAGNTPAVTGERRADHATFSRR